VALMRGNRLAAAGPEKVVRAPAVDGGGSGSGSGSGSRGRGGGRCGSRSRSRSGGRCGGGGIRKRPV
jgi:hypothetical protein